MATEQPAWKSFTADQLAAIEKARKDTEAKGDLKIDPKGTYGIVCRACTKPNAPNATFCTGCSFPATKWDLLRLPDNVFLQVIKGEAVGTKVHYRDEKVLVFDDKFGVSDNHIDVIPIAVYEDVTVLTAAHVPLLEEMYATGKKQLESRNLPWLKGQDIDAFISSGYNFPVSVKHLHVHMILPPFKHNKILQYPRWHNHHKVVADLKKDGKVHLYNEHPNETEGKAEYDRAMKNQEKALEIIAALSKPAAGATPAK